MTSLNYLTQRPILILDFGSQYTELIARRIREMNVYCEVHPCYLSEDYLASREPCGIILSGGPATVTDHMTPRAPAWVFTANLPILGICYGMQTMAAQLGGGVFSSSKREFGHAKLSIVEHSSLFEFISACPEEQLDVWMSHGDAVSELPPGFNIIASTSNTPIAGMSDEGRRWFGVQFHPEVTHTQYGQELLGCFVLDICRAIPEWTTQHIMTSAIESIEQKVGGAHVLLALSGGVDSSVVAALLHRALGERLTCVFVDHGLLRFNEAEQVVAMFEPMGIKLIVVNAEQKFLQALAHITCPEEKRKIIGRTFIEIFEEEAKRLPKVEWLAQGTIYPDVIESAAAAAGNLSAVIKSHHNVGGLPEKLQLKLLEPIRELFKDEVRQLGLELGLAYDMVYRHPFPGPGLGVRILGEVKREYIEILRRADKIFLDELHAEGLYQQVSQAFAVFLPVRSVGVIGDERHYDFVICLRAVETTDFMTAKWSALPWKLLAKVSNRIINEVAGVSRVTYDISSKPPATIEWE